MRFILLISAFAFSSANAQEFRFDRVFSNLTFNQPIFLAGVPDGSGDIVVVQKDGFIQKISRDNPNQSIRFLDIQAKIVNGGEQGFLGFAFDPNYSRSGYAYLSYSERGTGDSIISRVKKNTRTGILDASTEEIILRVDQPYSNHNGGMIAFGPDGYLYFGLGDGGSGGDPQGNGQNMNSLLGKMLRLDVKGQRTYRVPADNPFVGQANVKAEIWASGLRNPWRFSFDRLTGRLWAGDVGQGSREEVSVITKGGNFGWNVYEGNASYREVSGRPRSEFVFPILDYGRGEGSCITGGYVYRGTAVPSLYGRYIFGDFGSGRIWSVKTDGVRMIERTEIARISMIASFGEDSSGELYAISIGGQIFKLVPGKARSRASLPSRLSETGFFRTLDPLEVEDNFHAYSVQVPFLVRWSKKTRWFNIPNGTKIQYSAIDTWTFPVGTIFVKHFENQIDSQHFRPVETRVFLRTETEWQSFAYQWREDFSDADLVEGQIPLSLNTWNHNTQMLEPQMWMIPSESECMTCHNSGAGYSLGLNTFQLNHDNQIENWIKQDLFENPPESFSNRYPNLHDTTAPLEDRARAYLASNCSYCHREGGIAPGDMDMRFEIAKADMHLIGAPAELGDLGLRSPLRIRPGQSSQSVLYLRLSERGRNQMPLIGSFKVDPLGNELIRDWINQMPAQ